MNCHRRKLVARVPILIATLLMSFACSDESTRTFRAGAHAVDVTPTEFPVIVNGGFLSKAAMAANDPLHARALVLDDGSNRVAITVVDSCMMPRELLDQAKDVASSTTGIPVDRMLISATHTHSAPSVMGALGTDVDPNYPGLLARKIVEAIEGAVKNLAPARVGWAVVRDPELTHCRRWILRPDRMKEDPFGQQTVRANMHPGFQNPDFLGPAGAVDDGLSILSVHSTNGRPLALLANYAMHYVGPGSKGVSADYYGQFATMIKELIRADHLDPPFVGIMSQGTSGDQQWMDYGEPRQERNMYLFAEALSRVAYGAYKTIEYHDWVPIKMAEKKLDLSRRLPSEQRLTWAKKVVAKLEGRLPEDRPEVYAREQLYLAENPVRELKLQALRIGNLGITGIPNEVYGITGLKIKAHSPLKPTFNIELANGSEGYIPPPEQHRLGGYTTWEARTASLEVDAEPKIVNALLELLEEVSGKPRHQISDAHGSYAKAVLASKPVAYWKLNEMGGERAFDATANNHHGVYESGLAFYLHGPTLASFSSADRINRAPQFAGGCMRARLEGSGKSYAVEMWFYNALPVDARPETGYLFSCIPAGDGEVTGDHLRIGGTEAAAGKLVFSMGHDSSEVLAGATPIVPKTWNHVALVRDGRKIAVYLNGQTAPEVSGLAAKDSSFDKGQVIIGGRGDNHANFEGRIDEVALYDRALSAHQVARHYAASHQRSD